MPDQRGPSSRIELRVLRSHHTATMRSEVERSGLSLAMGSVLQAVKEALSGQGASGTSAPFARYHSMGDLVDFEAGLMVDAPIAPVGDVKPGQLPAGPALIAVHAGPYETLQATYDAMNRWLESSPDYVANGGPWELYITDPSAEPDPSKWLTEIIFPLRARS